MLSVYLCNIYVFYLYGKICDILHFNIKWSIQIKNTYNSFGLRTLTNENAPTRSRRRAHIHTAWRTASNSTVPLFAPRWQSREATIGAEQRANGGDEPRVAGRRGADSADATQPGAALGLHVGLGLGRNLALADA